MSEAVWTGVCILIMVFSIPSLIRTFHAVMSLKKERVQALEEEIQMTPRINRTTDMDSTIETKFRQRTAQSFQNPVRARQVSARVRRSRRIK